jgi:glyoxylase-like metal-dependent hydrolase (beta-lactamase superfamily II)
VRVGDYTLSPIETGTLRLDGGAMFGIIPRPLWEKQMPPDTRNRITLAMRSLLIQGGDRNILVDCGVGDKYSPKFAELYAVDHSEHTLVASLEAKGLGVEDITDVVLTHLHFDHCGGATRYEGDVPVPTFPNAKYYVQLEHFEHATSPNARERASFLEENFMPVREAGQLEIFKGPKEPWPGIELKVVSGHTLGQQLVVVRGEESVLYCADLVPTSAHIPAVWVMGYDIYPLRAMTEKQAVLTQAVQENWTLFFEHDPFTTACKVTLDEKGRFRKGDDVPFA